jgi:hypothetical protein
MGVVSRLHQVTICSLRLQSRNSAEFSEQSEQTVSGKTLDSQTLDILQALREEFEHNLSGYLHGKRVMRDFLVERFRLSEFRAEELLDDCERMGWVSFDGDPTEASHRGAVWKFGNLQVSSLS